jgi:four helix bundle protein
MGVNIIKEKSFDFALKIVSMYQLLVDEKREFVLSKQLLRSDSSVGANIREAEHAESKADFIHKMSISLKEANESSYWIELLFRSNYITENQYKNINNDLTEILKLLTSIIKTSKNKL